MNAHFPIGVLVQDRNAVPKADMPLFLGRDK